MTKIAIWCRHKDDNIIGIGPHIPWYVKSDFQRYKRITIEQAIVVGQKTYESFPNQTLPNRKIYILTFDKDYQVSDANNHFVINNINEFKDINQDLYISGGASIYKLFMCGDKKLMPEIVVDCEYHGELDPNLEGDKIDITESVNVLSKKYRQVSADFELDNIITRVYALKGEFVEQEVIKRIITAIEQGE